MFSLLEYVGYRIYSVISRILPLKFVYKIADFIGYLVFVRGYADSKKRAIIMQRIYNGKIDFGYAYRMVCKNIQYFNRDLVDFFRSGKLNKINIDSFIEVSGFEYIDNGLKLGKGVVLASAHIGSWEMIGIVCGIKGYQAYGMIWALGNKLVANMFKKIRYKKGVGTAGSSSLRHILELLKKNKIIGIMLDVDGGNKGVPYSLWGYNVRLPRGPASFSQYVGSSLLVAIMQRNKDGGYKLYIEKPDTNGTTDEITIKMFEIVKKHIVDDPVQWHWIKYFFEH